MESNTGRLDPCPACGSDYEITYYQRRAADEPQDSVIYCPNCPLDTAKLSLNYSLELSSMSTDNNPRAIKTTKDLHRKNTQPPFSSVLEKISSKYVIKVEGNAAKRCYESIDNSLTKLSPVIEIPVPVQINQNKQVAKFQVESNTRNEAHILVSSSKIAPYILLQEIDVLTQKSGTCINGKKLVSCYECLLDNIVGSNLTILRTLYAKNQPHILIFIDDNYIKLHGKNNAVVNMLQYIMTTYGTETSIKSFISTSIISSLYIQSGKAYDWPSAPSQGYSFAWKPDGERFWYVKYGYVWLFCRRLLSGRITGWNITSSSQVSCTMGPVLDVEVMIGHNPILIDILVLESGLPISPLRSLDYVLQQYKLMEHVNVPIFIREYFRSEKEVLSTKNTIGYPTDGVVGIEDNSMDIIKLKHTKSIELKLCDNGDLVSSDDRVVMTSMLQNTYEPGNIIEIRFTKQSYEDIPIITETLLRTDKLKANSYEVCEDIINTISDMPDTLARRKAVTWCSTVRQKLHQIAANNRGKGRVVMDIGSGDGQAISDYSTDSDVTYLLIEPSLSRCKKLYRRIGESGASKCRLYETTSSILKVLSMLSSGSLKYAIVNSTLEAVLNEDQCIKVLKSCIRYCIASFSISYISRTLNFLGLQGVDVIGCGYMYDDADDSGVLINEYGVVMKRNVSSNTATVVWGTDTQYEEPSIVKHNFKDVFHTQLATNLVPVLDTANTSLVNTISTKVYIISTKKYL